MLELSSFQLETTHSLRTAAATVLNVTPDHLDRYGTLADYAAAKARIFDGCDVAVVNLDDCAGRAHARGRGSRVIRLQPAACRSADYSPRRARPEPLLTCRGEALLPVSAMTLHGRHNAANALAALAIGEALGSARARRCLEALRRFGGLPHRAQWVADLDGVRFINDSKGTNVGATVAPCPGLPGRWC